MVYYYSITMRYMANVTMIIQLCSDNAVRDSAKMLHNLYPNESVRSRFDLFNDSTGLASREDDGSPVERITVISHAGLSEYAGVDAAIFSQRLIKKLKKLPSADLSRIHTLDLIGCSNGLIQPDGRGFSSDVAEKLSLAGYGHIQVQSFTNMIALEPHPFVKLSTIISGTGEFIIQGLRTETDVTLSKEINENRNDLYKNYNDLGFKLKELEYSARTPGVDPTVFITQMRDIEAQQAFIIQEITALNARQLALGTEILRTMNPRDVLDKNPQCHFTTRYLHHLKGNKGLSHPIHTAIETDNVGRLERIIQKDSSCLNLPDETGLTPLLLAIMGNHPSCVQSLLKQGADVTLQVTYPLPFLKTQFAENPAALKRLERLTTERSDKTTISIDAFDMAYLIGRGAILQQIHDQCLFMASKAGDRKQIEKLVFLPKSNINIQNKAGFTPLGLSIIYGHMDCAELLMGDGKPPPLESKCTCASLFAMLSDEGDLSRAADLVIKKTSLETGDISPESIISLKASDIAEIKGNDILAQQLREQEALIASSITTQANIKSEIHDLRSSATESEVESGRLQQHH